MFAQSLNRKNAHIKFGGAGPEALGDPPLSRIHIQNFSLTLLLKKTEENVIHGL